MLNFTIVIPTRNRSDALLHTIKNVLQQEYSDMQVLIADNSSDTRTQELINSFNDERLVYMRTGPGLSMSANWEKALELLDTGWVTVLGDDDALLTNALQTVNNISRNTDAKVIRSVSADYIWPGDPRHPFGYLSFILNKSSELVDSKTAIQEVLTGKRSYTTLPMLYNGGFVDSSLIKEAKKFNDLFYHSRIPDVYSAFAFAFLTESYFLYNHPLAINGTSKHSGGTAFFQYDESSPNYEPAKLFALEENLPNHPFVPILNSGIALRSIHAHVLEAFLQARDVYDSRYPLPDFEEQLKLIIGDNRESPGELSHWIQDFKNIHRIKTEQLSTPLGQTTSLSFTRNIRNKLVGKIRLFTSWPKVFIYEGHNRCLIETVPEAEKIIRKITNKFSRYE